MSCDDAQRSLPQRTARLFIKRNESCLFPECRLEDTIADRVRGELSECSTTGSGANNFGGAVGQNEVLEKD